MPRSDAIGEIRARIGEIRVRFGVRKLAVFGSVARDQVNENSDVDVVVRVLKPDLFMLVGIKHDLEERLHRPVDIVTYRKSMNQFLKKRIDEVAVYA